MYRRIHVLKQGGQTGANNMMAQADDQTVPLDAEGIERVLVRTD